MKFVFILILYAVPNAYTVDPATPTITFDPHEYTSASQCKKAANNIIGYIEDVDGPLTYTHQCLKKKRVD